MRNLKQVNHLLDLNYDCIIDREKISLALKSIEELQDEMERVYKHYCESGDYIDEESISVIEGVYAMLEKTRKVIG